MAAKRPDIAADWHPTENGDKGPEDYLPQSNKVVMWLCPKGHTYPAAIDDRVVHRKGCPHPDCRKKVPDGEGTSSNARYQRRKRHVARDGAAILAGDLDAKPARRTLDPSELEVAHANALRLRDLLGYDLLGSLLHRSPDTVERYRRDPVSRLVAARLQFLVDLADILGPNVSLANWLQRPHVRLSGQAPEALLGDTDWEPIHGGPATLLMVARQGYVTSSTVLPPAEDEMF